ncbi:sensor histidine kinase [Acrocarpospora catenulata]|uniref:sensor histidine kinase n=1 Tax=Acrocarpospora catenulata TaxID=2836182 RepID=UPI001BDB26B1|nr:ATP-binding protein [Acrocarpospora catenulata]
MSLPWWRTRSIRGRLTLGAMVIAVLVLIPIAIAADLAVRYYISQLAWDETTTAASGVVSKIQSGHLTTPIPANGPINLIQAVAPGGRIVATTNAARDLPALSPVWPSPQNRIQMLVSCPLPGDGCIYVTAIRADVTPGSLVVYAGRETPLMVRSRVLAAALTAQVLLLTAFIGWVAWKIAGRVLRPVDDIRQELAELTERNLNRRVPVPAGSDELARLAMTANRALDRLEDAMERQRQFAADASHELRTPIAGIRAQLESGLLHHEDMPDAIRAALRDTARLELIVNDLLFLARIGSSRAEAPEEVDLTNLVTTHVANRPARLLPKLTADQDVRVYGVESQLARALTELLVNADRHAAGSVSVEVRRRGGEAVVVVANDGEPIAAADRERIFERFTRLDSARSRDRGGTGLGLAIVREVVEAHGGTVAAESDGQGVRFVIRLPLARLPLAAAELPQDR